ncbi:metallophosphoesterase [Falsiroseomonas sp.]|uniref:metallophosphoesterase n=1 Tax=Falsiroseomonas sp. TaxID=2870721 RepID=UPI0034A58880
MVARHGPGSAAPAAFAVVTGDLTHHGEPAAYRRLAAILEGLPFPVHLLIGNHDDRAAFSAAFPAAPRDGTGFVQQALPTPAGLFVMLDTQEPGTHAGRLCQARLDWLAATLAGSAGDVLLFLHHPPFTAGIAGMDKIKLVDADALWAVLAPHAARLRHIFHGHLHRPLAGSWKGIPFSSLRGTAHQVALDLSGRPGVPGSREPPAYAFVRVGAEGRGGAHPWLSGPHGCIRLVVLRHCQAQDDVAKFRANNHAERLGPLL